MALQNYQILDMAGFFSNKMYYIPNYQREYAWEINEITDFLNDLEETTRYEDLTHFFGQIVVHDDEQGSKKYIIDGQQRTITSVIFLRILQLFFKELFSKFSYKRANKKYILISNLIGEYDASDPNDTSSPIRLHLGDKDDEFFEEFIFKSNNPDEVKVQKKSQERIKDAFKTMYAFVYDTYSKAQDGQDKLEVLEKYYDTFTLRFKVLYMEATKLDEAFVIFETLNARGKDLETADLLKNYIFSKAKSDSIDDAQKLWTDMTDSLNGVDTTSYIRHFWNSRNDLCREKELYRRIVNNTRTPDEASELLKNLAKYSSVYHDMTNPDDASIIQDEGLLHHLKNLKILKAKTFYPIILAMYQSKQEYTENDFSKVAESLEWYTFRNSTICGKVANKTEVFMCKIANRIFDDLTSVDDICNEILSGAVEDDEFKTAFMAWSKKSKTVIRYILRKIDKTIEPHGELVIANNNDVHIEHIMPENNGEWKIVREIHDEYLWKLGNLTLLSGRINTSISNKKFSDKVQQYKESKIELNKYLYETSDGKERKKWNVPKDIDERQEWLAKKAVITWPKKK